MMAVVFTNFYPVFKVRPLWDLSTLAVKTYPHPMSVPVYPA
jgi:hypothetical protein